MLKTFEEWVRDRFNEELPKEEINGVWFSEKGLPMIVRCACCEMTMALPNAMVDEYGYTICASCAESEE